MPMRRRSSNLLCLLAAAAAIGAAQEEKPAAVEGDVRDSVTGGPVVRAHVLLSGQNGKPQTYGAITDAEGKFVMNGLSAGSYTATVQRAGFVTPIEPGAQTAHRISLAAGDRKTEFHLKLTPAGAITGRVLDAHGEPMEGVPVEVEGSAARGMTSGAITDDKGQFRIGGLAPRKYRVKAQPMMLPTPPEIRTDGTVESNYVATFYPNSREVRSAGRVEVKAGEEVTGVDIRLVESAPVRVSGTVSGLPAGVKNAMLELRKDGGMSSSGTIVKPNGTFQVWRVAPGKYRLSARWNDNGQSMSSTVLDIDLAGTHLDGLELKMVAPSDIAGQVIFDDEQAKGQPPEQKPGQQPQRTQPRRLMLRETSGTAPQQQATVADDGAFRLTGVAPGRYRVIPGWARVYVKSLQLGQVHLDGNILDLRNGPAGGALDVVVSSAVSDLTGVVEDGKGPVEGARVALMLEDADSGAQPAMTIAGPGGIYRFQSLTPGRYRVAAIEDNDELMWNSVEDYEDIMATVDLHAGEKATRDLKRR
jgi:hypothetical protein